jgi:hypothetical protein
MVFHGDAFHFDMFSFGPSPSRKTGHLFEVFFRLLGSTQTHLTGWRLGK